MKKLLLILIAVILIAAAAIIGGRVFNGGEDTWLCQGNQWVKHGNPSRPMPTEPCPVTAPSERGGQPRTGQVQSTASSLPANATFVSDDFELTYPNWPHIASQNIAEPEQAKVAVTNAGCAFVVAVRQIPAGQDPKTFLEQTVAQQVGQAKVTLLTKEISDSRTHLEGEFTIGKITIHTSQFGFVTSKRQVYSLLFAAEKKTFEAACKPFVASVVESVKVK